MTKDIMDFEALTPCIQELLLLSLSMLPSDMKTHISRSVDYIINCSMEKFTELLSSEGLTEEQAACCRDIRRRGKNKVRRDLFDPKYLQVHQEEIRE